MHAAGRDEPVNKMRVSGCVTGAGRQANPCRPREIDTHSRLNAWANFPFSVKCIGSLHVLLLTGHMNCPPKRLKVVNYITQAHTNKDGPFEITRTIFNVKPKVNLKGCSLGN